MVLILFGNIVYVIHKINYQKRNHLLKIHFRKKFQKTTFFEKQIFFRMKAEFIRAKYQQMTYINRLKDETNETLDDLNLVKTNRFLIKSFHYYYLAITFNCSN